MKRIKKVLMAALVVLAGVALVGCKKTGLKYTKSGEYTYLTYTSALGTNWNAHTWETSADNSILSYISSPLVDLSAKNTETGEYQWVWEMATSITDVTKDHNDDLVKYKATLGDDYVVNDGKIQEVDMEASIAAGEYVFKDATIEEGYVYEIKLREGAKWENGVAINADTYIESMDLLLDPTMKNYRANTYISGEAAVANAYYRFYSESQGVGDASIGYPTWADATAADYADLVWKVDASNDTAFDEWFQGYVSSYVPGAFADETALLQSGFGADFTYEDVTSLNGKTYKEIQADETMKAKFETIMGWWVSEGEDEYLDFFVAPYTFAKTEFSEVGLYKVDEYTIRYVCQTSEDYYYFLTSMTSNWLVYAPLYNQLKDTTGELVTTKYGTSKDTTMSYGTYKIASLQDGKQIIFVQNENWYGFTEKDGKLYSETEFEVNGAKQQQYQTTRIVIDVMQDAAAKEAFLKGLLDDWAPAADELSAYSSSTQLYQVDETYTMRFFFNTNLEVLQKLDSEGGNSYSVVLSNDTFRKAFSLSINRTEFVTATSGYKAAYSLMNSLYFYNVYEDPTSIFRNTDEAMQSICDLYGVEYGQDKAYATLAEAYKSINGYNLTEAKKLMKQACEELVAAGLYVEGQAIKIKIGYKKGSMETDELQQVSLMNSYINAACEGSGFGTITLEGIGNLEDRYGDVPKGNYAIGYGAWGGAAFYPFTLFQVYMDADKYDLNEAGCWDPTTEALAITFPNNEEKYGELAGTTDSMSYTKWSGACAGNGKYANASFAVKIYITAQLELNFLNKYYCIPLCSTTACSLLSYKTSNFTENYNIMYGFGGLRLMKYNYDDTEWNAFVKEQKKLSYN